MIYHTDILGLEGLTRPNYDFYNTFSERGAGEDNSTDGMVTLWVFLGLFLSAERIKIDPTIPARCVKSMGVAVGIVERTFDDRPVLLAQRMAIHPEGQQRGEDGDAADRSEF